MPCEPQLPAISNDLAEGHDQAHGASHYSGPQLRYRAGELDPFEVDHVLFHYSRAAKELWKFCNSSPVEMQRR